MWVTVTTQQQHVLSHVSSLLSVVLPAALIRGNRKNCAQFSGSLDWLISRLERLEASSGRSACL